jgi:hypothetical protein
MVGDLSLLCRFSDDEGHGTCDLSTFYDRNPIGKGLDFGDDPQNCEPFLWYSFSLQCPCPVKYIVTTPLPPLEYIVHGIFLGSRPYDILGSSLRKDSLERALHKANGYTPIGSETALVRNGLGLWARSEPMIAAGTPGLPPTS